MIAPLQIVKVPRVVRFMQVWHGAEDGRLKSVMHLRRVHCGVFLYMPYCGQISYGM